MGLANDSLLLDRQLEPIPTLVLSRNYQGIYQKGDDDEAEGDNVGDDVLDVPMSVVGLPQLGRNDGGYSVQDELPLAGGGLLGISFDVRRHQSQTDDYDGRDGAGQPGEDDHPAFVARGYGGDADVAYDRHDGDCDTQ